MDAFCFVDSLLTAFFMSFSVSICGYAIFSDGLFFITGRLRR
jgi:hypothetical protein